MPDPVKRCSPDWIWQEMTQELEGEYVLYEDYAKVVAQRNAARKIVNEFLELAAGYYGFEGMSQV